MGTLGLLGLMGAAAGVGWFIGRKIDERFGISTWLGNKIGGDIDYLPADKLPLDMARKRRKNGSHEHTKNKPHQLLTSTNSGRQERAEMEVARKATRGDRTHFSQYKERNCDY